MKKRAYFTLIGLLASAMAGSSFTRAQAAQVAPQQVYYTALKGTYSFLAPSYYGYYVSQGTLTFDGKGHVTGVLNGNYDTVPCIGMTLNGTYTVNPGLASGSAVMSLAAVSPCTNANGDTLSVALTIGAGSNVIYLTEVDPDTAGYFIYNLYAFGATATHY